MVKIYQHRKEKSYRGSRDSFGNGMTRVITWEGVEVLVVILVFLVIPLPGRAAEARPSCRGWQCACGRNGRTSGYHFRLEENEKKEKWEEKEQQEGERVEKGA